jgi:serine O-acetyltransferase
MVLEITIYQLPKGFFMQAHLTQPKKINPSPGFFTSLRDDLKSALVRDPAARSRLEIALLYPGLHAIWIHRVSHWLWAHHAKLPARWLSQLARGLTGIEIHPGATIGQRVFIDHGMGVVIGETAEVGDDATLYHGVTLGGTSLEKGKRHPTIGERVTIGAGAKVLGNITIGTDSRIGANAVVVKSVPENSVVVGVPGQIVKRTRPHQAGDAPDLNHTSLPDVFAVAIKDLMARVDELEGRVEGHSHPHPHHVHAPVDDAWQEADFVI